MTLWLALWMNGCASDALGPGPLSQDSRIASEQRASGRGADITIQLDDQDISHIHAASDAALAYGLGYVHARDRLFQMLVLRYAAAGRLSEILGEAHLEQDRRLRLLGWRIDEAEAALSARDRVILQAYVDGVDAGARSGEASFDMGFSGPDFPPMQIADALRIARLYAWEMDAGLEEELARARIIARLPASDARLQALLSPVPGGNVSVVAPAVGDVPAPERIAVEAAGTQSALSAEASLRSSVRAPGRNAGKSWRRTKSFLGLGTGNAWAISGAHTESGAPILVSSPHGFHRSPALYYQVHLAQPDFSWQGVTLPGLPLLLTGQSQNIAWASSSSRADTQDLLRVPQRDGTGTPGQNQQAALQTSRWPQEFRVGGKMRLREVWQSTPQGPILPPGFAPLQEVGAQHALLWTGFIPEALAHQFSGYFDLAKARTLREAESAIEKIGTPSTNLLLAFSDGTITYRLAGLLVRRDKNAPHDRPRLLRDNVPVWRERLREVEKPRVDRPFSGLLVSANQRIVSDADATSALLGQDAALPYRALRIHQLLREKRAEGLLNTGAMVEMQQDVLSLEALRLAPILAAHCPRSLPPHPAQMLATYCQQLVNFDGAFHTQSTGALPYSRLKEALYAEILATHLGEDVVADLVGVPFIDALLLKAIEEEYQGSPHPLLDDRRSAIREGLSVFVARATHHALQRLQQEGWPLLERWGDFHRFRSRPFWPVAPLVTLFWDAVDLPQSGSPHAICAETDGEITQGALFRFVSELKVKAEGSMVLDGVQRSTWPGAVLSPVHQNWQQGRLRPLQDAPTKNVRQPWRVLYLQYSPSTP